VSKLGDELLDELAVDLVGPSAPSESSLVLGYQDAVVPRSQFDKSGVDNSDIEQHFLPAPDIQQSNEPLVEVPLRQQVDGCLPEVEEVVPVQIRGVYMTLYLGDHVRGSEFIRYRGQQP
jgi:hypothetical protein